MKNENRNLRSVFLFWTLACWILVMGAALVEQRINHNAEVAELKTELAKSQMDIQILEKDLETYANEIYSLNMQRGRVLAELERARQAE